MLDSTYIPFYESFDYYALRKIIIHIIQHTTFSLLSTALNFIKQVQVLDVAWTFYDRLERSIE